jgi:hypothetical protein
MDRNESNERGRDASRNQVSEIGQIVQNREMARSRFQDIRGFPDPKVRNRGEV